MPRSHMLCNNAKHKEEASTSSLMDFEPHLEKWLTNYRIVLGAQGVPEEELVLVKVNRDELRRYTVLPKGRALDYAEPAGPLTPHNLRGQRQKQLVGEARRDEGVVQGGPALDEEIGRAHV